MTDGQAAGRMSRSSSQELKHLERATATQLYLSGQEVRFSTRTSLLPNHRPSPTLFRKPPLAQTRRALDEAAATEFPGSADLVFGGSISEGEVRRHHHPEDQKGFGDMTDFKIAHQEAEMDKERVFDRSVRSSKANTPQVLPNG